MIKKPISLLIILNVFLATTDFDHLPAIDRFKHNTLRPTATDNSDNIDAAKRLQGSMRKQNLGPIAVCFNLLYSQEFKGKKGAV